MIGRISIGKSPLERPLRKCCEEENHNKNRKKAHIDAAQLADFALRLFTRRG